MAMTIGGGICSSSIAAYQAKIAYQGNSLININSTVNNITREGARRIDTDTFAMHHADSRMGTIIGGWNDIMSSAAVFKTRSYSVDDPAYKVRRWDAHGTLKDRDVRIAAVVPSSSDEVEMLALSSHLVDTGELANAQRMFLKMRQMIIERRGVLALDGKIDWLGEISAQMQAEYAAGNIKEFGEYKAFWDRLLERESMIEPAAGV